jgi:hypothetical protein
MGDWKPEVISKKSTEGRSYQSILLLFVGSATGLHDKSQSAATIA